MNKLSCQTCKYQYCASQIPLFSSLEKEELELLTQIIIHKSYLKGEIIITEGSSLEKLIFINSGKARAFRNSLDGKEQILYLFTDGDFFGEKNLLSKQQANYSVKALEDTQTCMIDKSDFQEILKNHPAIGLKVIEALCSKIDRLEEVIKRGNQDVESRINAVILEFSQKYASTHPKGLLINLPLNQEGIANYVGAARETVSRKMRLLQDEGVIEMIGSRKMLLKNIDALH